MADDSMTPTTSRPASKPDRTGTKNTSEPQTLASSSSSSFASSYSSKKNKKKEVDADAEEMTMTGRERLKRHRMEMAGRVWIPEMWGQEGLLKEWIDSSSVVERSLVPKGLVSARAALVEECRRANSGSPQIKNPC